MLGKHPAWRKAARNFFCITRDGTAAFQPDFNTKIYHSKDLSLRAVTSAGEARLLHSANSSDIGWLCIHGAAGLGLFSRNRTTSHGLSR